jgi:mannose-6-phosphate isomerase-like protein (cupin superfamily)
MTLPVRHRADAPDDIAPDGAEIRALISGAEGATRLSLAEALVPVGGRTSKVYHQTVYEEVWYILQGTGTMHLQASQAAEEEVFQVAAGDAVLIVPRHGFWVQNTGDVDLIWLCCGSPPWPGAAEAQPWPPSSD